MYYGKPYELGKIYEYDALSFCKALWMLGKALINPNHYLHCFHWLITVVEVPHPPGTTEWTSSCPLGGSLGLQGTPSPGPARQSHESSGSWWMTGWMYHGWQHCSPWWRTWGEEESFIIRLCITIHHVVSKYNLLLFYFHRYTTS